MENLEVARNLAELIDNEKVVALKQRIEELLKEQTPKSTVTKKITLEILRII